MKFFHLSDLHLGKRVNELSMLEDQWDILQKIVVFAKEHKPDAVLIAGDVYDKSMPIVEAVQLLDRFLVWLNELGITVFIISGNHDNAERVAFGAELLKNSSVHIVQSYNGKIAPVTLSDGYGDINIWMLPYLKPSLVRRHFPDKDVVTYSDAISAALSNANLDASTRNVLIAHQFVTGAITSESEEISVGGSENVDGSVFDGFDYVALGHIHRPQQICRETLRYSGTPLKYSFSEASHTKSVTVVDMGGKGEITISELPLAPLRDMREVRGTYNEIMNRNSYRGTNTEDYIHIVLTDEQDEPDAISKLRNVYPNLMRLEYDNRRTQTASSLETVASTEKKTPSQLFGELFEMQNGQPMSEDQSKYVTNLFNEIWEEVVNA
ncbi:exonuclease SbcCD subunit D [Gudongella oleilytica]|uniref:exonuclease SbcCD subunit D n=1 Tax=Gudongella oleilytica TaxID=1582259 RepID=UPI002A372055|nr:exonuclease SbcCD subunit D [Gudongella oleilytica]MDY0256210.1 exonuclease SbcCD subunit D [Gudongella oleilytica]